MALANTPVALEYQRAINGVVYGFSDLTIQIGAGPAVAIFDQFDNIDYDWTVDKQEQGGTSPVPVGYTAGKVSFKGSFTISAEQSQQLIEALCAAGGVGASRVPFVLTINYGPITGVQPDGRPRYMKDTLYSCFLTSGSNSHSYSGALKRKHDFVFTLLDNNGLSVI